MENLSKIEKIIVDYLCESELTFIKEEAGSYQFNLGSIKTIISILINKDEIVKNTGLEINFDNTLNEFKIFLLESPDNKGESIIVGNREAFQRLSYYTLIVPKFLDGLEKNGYLDKVNNIYPMMKRIEKSTFPIFVNNQNGYLKTLEMKDFTIVSQFVNCLNYLYTPTSKLIEFKINEYKTAEKLSNEKNLRLSSQNVKIATYGLYISLLIAFTSFIAILITLSNLNKPTTVKFDDKQMNSLQQLINSNLRRNIIIDTIHNYHVNNLEKK